MYIAKDRSSVETPPYANTTSCHPVTDKERIEGFLKGSRREHEEIVGWISVVVRSRLWEERVVADDVIADTVMKLLLNFREGTFRLESSLKTHVQRIALYTLVDATRREKRFTAIGARMDPPDPASPQTIMERTEEQEMIRRSMDLLPENCRELLTIVFDQRLTYKEIATLRGTTEGAIKTQLSRCRERIHALVRTMR
jgi:RNA polymerase sigma factor (sigma-70 family)